MLRGTAKKLKKKKGERTQRHKGEGSEETQAETGVMQPQAKPRTPGLPRS